MNAPTQTGGGGTRVASPGAFTVKSLGRSDKEVPWLNMLIYGSHGAGKSTLLASAADVVPMNDVLIVAAEGGEIVYEDNDRIANSDQLDLIKVERIEQLQKVYEFLKAHISLRDAEGPEADAKLLKLQQMILPEDDTRVRRWRTVIVDSLSEIEAYNLAKILNLDAMGLDAGEEFEVAGFAEFRRNNHIIQRMVRQFRDLDIHVLMTCAQSFSQDERKAYHYGPKLTGQLSGIVQGFFDVVGWLVVGQKSGDEASGPRRLFVQPQSVPKADAKCRLAAYKSDYFDNPVMRDIVVGTGIIKDVGK